MRIAFLSIHGHVDPVPNLGLTDTGGQVVYVLELAKQLGEKGHTVDIYTRLFNNKKLIEYVSPNVQIIRIPCGPPHFVRKEEMYPYLDEFVDNMVRYIRNNNIKYDVIHSHYWDAGYVAKRLKLKLSEFLWAHTSHSLGLIKKTLLGEKAKATDYRFDVRIRTEKEILEKSDLLISASPIEPEYASKFYGVSREFELVPPGVDTDFFNPKNTKNIDLPDKYIFSTGRIEWTKGFDLLTKAFAIIAKKYKDVYLVLGGGSKEPTELEKAVRAEINRIAKKNDIDQRVIQTGRIPNESLPTYYTKAKITVLPSRYDLFGMVALEALSCETPVVVSKYAGVSKLIKPEFGLIADPKNPEDLAEKMEYLLNNEEKAEAMGKNGRQYILQNFTWERLAGKLIEIYQKHH